MPKPDAPPIGATRTTRTTDQRTTEEPDSAMGVEHVHCSQIHPGRATNERVVPQQDRPVGWYRDAAQPTGHRYWDGQQWLVESGDRD
jgi:hypothetical protein